jgi:uncharacterized membrane protein
METKCLKSGNTKRQISELLNSEKANVGNLATSVVVVVVVVVIVVVLPLLCTAYTAFLSLSLSLSSQSGQSMHT